MSRNLKSRKLAILAACAVPMFALAVPSALAAERTQLRASPVTFSAPAGGSVGETTIGKEDFDLLRLCINVRGTWVCVWV